ncbi:MAG: disulfide bond formation protein DsbA [Actinomycetota bacterium]
MSTTIDFWVDPACPFCWATARWAVDEVAPHRGLDIQWRPISLLFKNEPPEDSPYFAAVNHTHRLLRVMESVRTEYGNDGVFKLYWELGARIHHDGEREFTATDALEAVGLDTRHAAAYDDEGWDTVIRSGMDDGLGLVGSDVGTPIIAKHNSRDERVGYFGPVITKIPPTEESLKMWDALEAMMDVDGFFELKKTRTEGPNPGPRPA